MFSEETPASPINIVPAGADFIPLCVPWSPAQQQQQLSQSTPRMMDASSTPRAPPPNGPICRRRINFDDADDVFQEAVDVIIKIAKLLLRTASILIQNR